jgi:Asp-tRNA(Asn)/Glu-tRNA(Gln) amidotransferase C subunit
MHSSANLKSSRCLFREMQDKFNKIIERVENLQAIYISDREGAIVIKGTYRSIVMTPF